jgi:secreted PhoX family phosphatase
MRQRPFPKSGRRDFIKQGAIISLGFSGLSAFAKSSLLASPLGVKVGFGPLIKDPEGVFDLPQGFSYKIISRWGDEMDDGFLVPGKADGMATFPLDEHRCILIRNHENVADDPKEGAFGEDYSRLSKIEKARVYDSGFGKNPALGGTTTLIYNHQTGEVERQYLSLAGTTRNCAGGPTPWGSWVTCEEDVSKAGSKMEVDHGYCFEVPASEEISLADPIPIKAMGRFNHEAICVDPNTGIVYLTEDRSDGLLYRFIPYEKENLHGGGKLEAMAFMDRDQAETRNWPGLDEEPIPLNRPFAVRWLELDNVEAPDDDLRYRGYEAGAARFARGEGMWFGDGEFYFACTNGGKIQKGQIWRYVPSPMEGSDDEMEKPGMLNLFAEPNDKETLKYCDNLTVSPFGDIMLCEDDSDPRVIGITRKGEPYIFAHNTGYKSELTGVCFSPNGKTMFVNIQHAGLTLAIEGNWPVL